MTVDNIPIHQKEFSIEWGDMDALGHVNNARYFNYFQEARLQWLASEGILMTKQQGPVVIHVACTFLKPIVYPATLTLKSGMHSLGRTSFFIDHELFQGSQLMAQGTCKIVWVDYVKNQAIPVPDKIRQLFDK